MTRTLACGAAALLLGACASTTVAVTPEGAEVASMREIIDAAPDGVPVRILVLHGQGAWEGWNAPDQARPPVAEAIAKRLMSGKGAEPVREPGPIDLGLPAPVFEIGSRTLRPSQAQWDGEGQACRPASAGGSVGTAEPHLDTVRFAYRGHPVTIFELSYWPVLGFLKCDQLIERDTALIGRDTESYRRCAERFPQAVNGKPLTNGAPRPAALNKAVKERLFEWGFGDAVLTTGPVGEVVHDAVLAAIRCAEAEGNPDRVAFVVTESLGSYVLIEALLGAVTEAQRTGEPGFVARADSLYMLANQWALLALADIGVRGEAGPSASELQEAMEARDRAPVGAAGEIRQIVAFNDPSDVLTYQTPDYFEEAVGVLEGRGRRVTVKNVTVPVARSWFGLFANPVAAHLDYRTDDHVLDLMVGED